MLCAIDASFVFQVLTRPLVGYNWVVSGMVVGVLDSVMDSVLDPNSLWPPAEVENLNKSEFVRISVERVFAA
jgi:hypothetical protein